MKYKIEYTTHNLSPTTGGKCYYPWYPKWGTCRIVINPKYKNDVGLLNHELKHCEQYNKNFFHSILYTCSEWYRYKSELAAYTEQIKAYGYVSIKQTNWIVNALYTKYDLSVSKEDIEEDILYIIKYIK